MSTANADPFDPDFVLLCRELCIDATQAMVERRWESATSLAEALTSDNLHFLLRVVFGIRDVKGNASRKWLRDKLINIDPTSSGNDERELQLMGAAAVLAIYLKADDMRISTALAVVTTGLQQQRRPELPFDIVARARRLLRETAESVRTRHPVDSEGIQAKLSDSFAKATEVFQQGAQDVPSAFKSSMEALKISVETMSHALFGNLNALQTSLSARDEELDMLWWLVGRRTVEGKAFNQLHETAQPILLASELSDLTQLLPGPTSISGLLAKAISRPDETSSVKDSVNACELQWMEGVLKADPSPVSQPIHYALNRRLETRDKFNWIAGWQAQTVLDAAAEVGRIALAESFYMEALQLKG